MNRYSEPKKDDPYLEHYGVKGMRWGVRRARSSESSSGSKPSRRKESSGEKKSSSRKKELSPRTRTAIAVGGAAVAAVGLAFVGQALKRKTKYKALGGSSNPTVQLGTSFVRSIDFNRPLLAIESGR